MGISVGIDLGTTNSLCCSLIDGEFKFLSFRGGSQLLPSSLLYYDGKMTVGDMARKKSVLYSENYISSSKTFIGDSTKKWVLDDRHFNATDVATEVLSYIKKEIEKQFNFKSESGSEFESNKKISAVITVPAYFTANQIDETKKAGEQSGFFVKQIIPEPVAAGIAYGFEDNINEKIAVIDIGGGTFDISLLEASGNSYSTLAIDGDNKLGGNNFDDIILEMCFRQIRKTVGIDLSSFESSRLSKSDYSQAKQRLILEAEHKKIELSSAEKVSIDIPNLFNKNNYVFHTEISRIQFEDAASPLIKRIERKIENCLREAAVNNVNNIHKVILVGGTSYIPKIQNCIQDYFNQAPYSDKDLSKLVAMGAAIIADDVSTVEIRDKISHSLGIRLLGGKFYPLLKKNEIYPISVSKVFPYRGKNSENFFLKIYEGEDDCVANNEFYGSLNLKGIADLTAGKPKIQVTFSFNKNRILEIKAKNVASGDQKTKSIQVHKE
ncbi:MAG: Hsp70 family protein [Desulfamplus sp.]|nr:Hsp70 family protein [Desulfamplus sp.]